MALIVNDILIRDISLNGVPINCVCVNDAVIWQRDASKYLRLSSTRVSMPESGVISVDVDSNTQWTVEPIYKVELSAQHLWLNEANSFTENIEITTTSLWDINN